MSDYYSVHVEGNREAWSHTPGSSGADFDQAVAEAAERAETRDRNYLVRHNGPQGSRVICTLSAGLGEIVWPRQATPLIARELEAGA
jgi:hypothetical protein